MKGRTRPSPYALEFLHLIFGTLARNKRSGTQFRFDQCKMVPHVILKLKLVCFIHPHLLSIIPKRNTLQQRTLDHPAGYLSSLRTTCESAATFLRTTVLGRALSRARLREPPQMK